MFKKNIYIYTLNVNPMALEKTGVKFTLKIVVRKFYSIQL